jgi:hypothetical protein
VGTTAPALATTPPMNDYEKKLRQVAKVNRSFQLPNALILNQVLSGLGVSMEYFLEKSGLLDKIADLCIMESGIYMAVELAYYDYYKYIENNITDNISSSMLEIAAMAHEEMKPRLIDAIIGASEETGIKKCDIFVKK